MKRLAAVVAVMAAGFAVGAAAPATAGNSALISNKVAKKPNGSFKAFRQLNVDEGETKIRFERVKNKTDEAQSVALTEGMEGADEDYTFTYRSKGTNMTADVQSGGYDFELAPGAKRIIRVKVVASSGTDPVCLGLRAEDSDHEIRFAGFDVNISLAGCLEA